MSFTVYRSSAGSGKTYTLVKEYLKIILPDTDSFRNILAVTFTNKAAGEMKQRVLSCLDELSGPMAGKGKATLTLLPALVEETGLSASEISHNAEEVLKKILHQYSDFAIGTIDSFSHRVIRAFAHDFGLPINFRVELDTDELLETAVDLLLDKAGDDEQITGLLVNFLENNIEDDKSWAIDSSLVAFSKLLLDEDSQQQLPKLRNLSIADFRKVADFLRKSTKEFEKNLKTEASLAWSVIGEAGLDHKAFAFGKSGVSGYFEQLSSRRLDRIIPAPRLVEAIEKDSWTSGKVTSADREKIERIKHTLNKSFREIGQLIETSYARYKLHKLLWKSVYPLAVLNSIDQILQEFKKQNNIIHISEFNSRIAKIVLGEPVPFIYERTGEKYRHILIDEFQDTSALQWQNFVPLIENSLASGWFNLVVGDGKQAIYRWRSGDVEQFTSLPALKGSDTSLLLKDRERSLERNFTELRLEKNFRSGREIVEFNNELFGFLSGLLDEKRQKVYQDLEQESVPGKPDGYVSITFSSGRDDDSEADGTDMESKVLKIVTGCIRDGYRPRDIAILCRVNTQASALARMLIEKSIPVVSGESLLLKYSPHVKMLTALARYVFGPVNPVIQAGILNRYSELKPEAKAFYLDWLNLSSDTERRTRLFEDFLAEKIGDDGLETLKMLPVYDLFIRLIRCFCQSSASDPYVQFFLNTVLKFSSDKSSSAPDFLEWWDEHSYKLSVVMPAGLNAVQVMTIHKAKGLQFPVVIYPFAGERLKNTRRYLWADLGKDEVPGLPAALIPSDKEAGETDFAAKYLEERQKSLLDLINVFYVVMTRPEQRLYVLSPPPPKKTGEPTSIPAFLKSWLMKKGLFKDDQLEYEFGKASEPVASAAGNLDVMPMPDLRFSDWRKKIRIRSRAPEIWNIDDPDRNRRFGNVLHTILAKLSPGVDAGDLIDAMLDNGLLERSREEVVRSKINTILNDPSLAFIFDEKADVRMEAEILTPEGHAVRPDRVIIKGGEALIVDYKTGRPMEKYRQQLLKYSEYLEAMGFKSVKKYLLYLEPEVRLEEVRSDNA